MHQNIRYGRSAYRVISKRAIFVKEFKLFALDIIKLKSRTDNISNCCAKHDSIMLELIFNVLLFYLRGCLFTFKVSGVHNQRF